MLLFLPLFGFSMTTNMMGMLVFFFLFTASLCCMLRQMHWGFPMELHHSGGIHHASQCQQKTAGNLLGAYHLL